MNIFNNFLDNVWPKSSGFQPFYVFVPDFELSKILVPPNCKKRFSGPHDIEKCFETFLHSPPPNSKLLQFWVTIFGSLSNLTQDPVVRTLSFRGHPKKDSFPTPRHVLYLFDSFSWSLLNRQLWLQTILAKIGGGGIVLHFQLSNFNTDCGCDCWKIFINNKTTKSIFDWRLNILSPLSKDLPATTFGFV